MSNYGYTVVQHSGFGYGGDTTFESALESRGITNAKERDAVTKVGGLVFDSYDVAEDYADIEQYQRGGHPLIPKVPGTFATAKVDGLAIYIPKVDA